VENIAFGKETWLNKERHKKRALGGSDDLNRKLAEKVRLLHIIYIYYSMELSSLVRGALN